jgi:hypothetical protein
LVASTTAAGAHGAVRGRQSDRRSLGEAYDRRVLVDRDAARLQRRAEAAQKRRAVDARRGRIEHRAVDAVHPHRRPRHERERQSPCAPGVDPRRGVVGGARRRLHLEAAVAREAAVDCALRGERRDDVDAAMRRREHPPRSRRVARLDAVDPVQHLAAVAAAGAVGQRLGLQQDDAPLGEALAQVPGRRRAGDAAADDGDIRGLVAAQRRLPLIGRQLAEPGGAVVIELVGPHEEGVEGHGVTP